MKKLKAILLLFSIVGLAVFAAPTFAANTADVTITASLGTGPPTVVTVSITDLAETSFTANGNITAIGGSAVTRRGFCYMLGESGDPTVLDTVAYEDGAFGVGAYSIGIAGLTINTHYRVRAYAVNGEGTAYGDTLQANTTIPANTILITGTGLMTITGPNPFTTNITSINISVSSNVDCIDIEVER
jgi:hypothetical protein